MVLSADMLFDRNIWSQFQKDMGPAQTALKIIAWVEKNEINFNALAS